MLVGLLAAAAGGAGLASGERFLQTGAVAVLGVLGGQVVLGLLAYATRFGVSAVGAAATVGGPLEIVSRGGHHGGGHAAALGAGVSVPSASAACAGRRPTSGNRAGTGARAEPFNRLAARFDATTPAAAVPAGAPR